MIKLDLMEYCQDCPYFEAEINKEKYGSPDTQIDVHTIISCKNQGNCGWLLNYLKEATGIYGQVRKLNLEQEGLR